MPKKKLLPKQTAPVSRNGVARQNEESVSESLSQYCGASEVNPMKGRPFAGDDAE
ncbi:MAG: anacyclamide/piricyclamide family prenylated cyclic peptide [Moorea sp. SIO1F2]|uniref:anacyclamide/piricyclamide family prenylated cyclic peptide n=1 Tax=unclassified Moorena TaxID=2683338 RepID=UPI0013B724CA|nr:anacyclamide/piricyclamide family prenylated cyclic peptide [Moorena sp. SIO3I7]NEO09903.1 anacyclamide/piricyclamide family prenylated cyclic peptide [Moorena sp. SIO3I8]NEO20595.1 anacyclamide/piricyclamide family prenylated cyclic peptide [Moorena sp. SIO4A5]NEP25774.1 anacyclamide/piricyclamide family prenylated cyclic peptide [Moorena sp. SIO3I6]NEQ58568.1 anacyclamide/piricyclamide family prenylated cyclic peptide [Moorena sp. SIO4A1]NET85207.1 anacyclamide/piricyclamide family prenyl